MSMPRSSPRPLPAVAVALGLLLLLCLPLRASAVNVTGLYKARVQVPDQSSQAREDALGTALGRVLTRLSGSSAEGLSATVSKIDAYVQQYQYETDSAGQLELVADFSPPAVKQLLRKNGQLVWGDERPATLVWLAVQSNGQREIVSRSSQGDFAQALRRQARRHGLPMALPLMDQQDRQSVAFADIWGGFFDQVMQASKRYHANAVLIGRLSQASSGWQGRWTLIQNGNRDSWQTAGDNPGAVLKSATGQLADLYINRYASRDQNGGETAAMTVSGVQGLDGYARVLNYLRGLSAVSGVTVLGVQADRLLLSLALDSSTSHLQQIIGLGRTLQQAQPPGNGAGWSGTVGGGPSGPQLYYRFVGKSS
ncbi:MAG TPA: DUF2066 domain-containing protein [Gammaproteobacteria bacterium]|nr:DUF2066 domain-containing protein [Gammaproteobacteria bacterium]